jgi:hypothetical protein
MKNLRKFIIIPGYGICLISSFLSVLFGINHSDGELLIRTFTIVSGIVFIGISLSEILSSPLISISEKIIWTNYIILLSPVSGLFYLLGGRQRIIPAKEIKLTD